jgi:hypothetical protein
MVARLAARGHAFGGLTAVAVGAALLVPAGAEASCSPFKPRERLAAASAAFIGRGVERQGDRVTYVVEESVKGGLGERVDVRDEQAGPGVTSIGNLAVSDRRVALFLRRDGAGFSADGCRVTSPEVMHVAAASGYARCAPVRVARLTTVHRAGRRLRLQAVLAHRDGTVIGVTVTWGDGALNSAQTRQVPGSDVSSVKVAHRYRSPGRYRVRIVARYRPTVDCALWGFEPLATIELSKPRARPVRVR